MPPSTTTQVEIFGEVYSVRGSDENGHLQTLADLVDRKMREVAEHVKGDTARIAILVALNLADELSQGRGLQNGQEGERVEIREKMAALTEELTHALEGGSRGIGDVRSRYDGTRVGIPCVVRDGYYDCRTNIHST